MRFTEVSRSLARSVIRPWRHRAARVPRVLRGRPDRQLRLEIDHLAACLELSTPKVFFVQIGAFDGKTDDPIHDHIVRSRWEGILVEPQGRGFSELKKTYRDCGSRLQLKNVAVAETPGVRSLYTVVDDPDLPPWFQRVASFNRTHVERHLAGYKDAAGLTDAIQKEDVECLTLEQLLQGVSAVDLLQVDAEGYDAEIIRMFAFSEYLPQMVVFEHKHLDSADHEAALDRLLGHGYSIGLTPSDTLAWLTVRPPRSNPSL